MASTARKVRRLAEKKVAKTRKGSKTMVRRYITLLSDISVLDIEGKRPYLRHADGSLKPTLSHREFIITRTADATFSVLGMAGIVSASAIRVAIDKLGPGDVLELDQDDWQRLVESVEKPKQVGSDGRIVETGYDGVAGPQLVPFARAIKEARLEDPRKKVEAEPVKDPSSP
jgi:hypothetical protein